MNIYRGSLLADYNRCQQYCFWRWYHNPPLESKSRSSALDIGTLTHECLHLWYKHLNSAPLEDRQQLVEAHIEASEVKDEIKEETRRLMKALAEIYPVETFTIIQPETTLVVQLVPNIDAWLKVTVDAVVQLNPENLKDRPLLVFEHKTASVSRGPVITAYLKSPQIIGYVWAVRRAFGLNVLGGLYNFLVKTTIADIVRMTTAISPRLQARWLESTLRTIAAIEESKVNGIWRQNLSACYTMYGECTYWPLCMHYNQTTLENYVVAPDDPIREELIIKHQESEEVA